ncbi:MAG: sigma 54-interacting transcriptional regulator [Pyrinomonadaceae bacterium]|nr:sigma 54-interacting transcriptional regulator [Pyrinomonadaceae bacterium]
MNKNTLSTKESSLGIVFGKPSEKAFSRAKRRFPEERYVEMFSDVSRKLDDGLSKAAEKILENTLSNFSHSPNNEAKLNKLLSYTYETQGNYARSLETIEKYDDEEILSLLEPDVATSVITQLAIAYNNSQDYPKAVALLNYALEGAKSADLTGNFGEIYVALTRVYRKLNENPIARDYAEHALNAYREAGDWHGMANAYHMIAMTYHQEGNSEKSVEFFEQAIQLIGSRSAPFLLGKLYSDLSGAYWFLRKPQDGIACLEKSINFFRQTEHKVQSIAALNNLGINLMLLGDWRRAEEAITQALDMAIEVDHAHVAGILDSLGEIKLLRGQLSDAQELLERGVKVAQERKKEWYAIQAMRNLARCFLAQGRYDRAEETALEAIEICSRIGESQIADMAKLVLAEVYLEQDRLSECETELTAIENEDPTTDFFVLGNIQRIRGRLALSVKDAEIALYHFNRSLTIFETAEDLYHTALAQFYIGSTIGMSDPKKAKGSLLSAADIFGRLGVKPLLDKTVAEIESVGKEKIAPSENVKRAASAVSQLLMLRLAEATASRELLFRELVAVLQQESKAKNIMIAEFNEEKRLFPFITNGYTPQESMELAAKYQAAMESNDSESFCKTKNIRAFSLRAPSAGPAVLIISPMSGAVLNDDSSIQPLLRVVELGMDVCALRERDKNQHTELESSPFTSNSLMPGFIHSSPAMSALVEEVYKIRSSDVTVLVTGESGTGKELVSRAIHTISSRKDKVFIPFNCTAVPKELAEGHLFGYTKGAFTGAVNESKGMIRAADGGTLFLDEVGDLPLDVQPKLLRFLQEGEVQPLGEKSPIKVDVRIIAATNMPLEEKVADGSFREDLYYRLNVIRLRVPPLRERRSEIPPIISYYINQYSARFGKRNISITPQTIDLLMVCEWEGNVRQLCNEIQRIVARAEDGETITPAHLSEELKRSANPIHSVAGGNVKTIASYDKTYSSFNIAANSGTIEEAVSELETQMIKDSLARHNWNISQTARELGLTRRGLYLKLERYGIERAA